MRKTVYIFAILAAFMFCTTQSVQAQEDKARLLQELEKSSDRFSQSFDSALDNSPLNGTSMEGDATRYVKDFEDSIDHLKKEFDNGKETRIAAGEVLTRAKAINKIMRRYNFGPACETDWNTVRADLNRVARAHGLKLKW